MFCRTNFSLQSFQKHKATVEILFFSPTLLAVHAECNFFFKALPRFRRPRDGRKSEIKKETREGEPIQQRPLKFPANLPPAQPDCVSPPPIPSRTCNFLI